MPNQRAKNKVKVQVWMTDEQSEQLETHAREVHGLSLTEFMRAIAEGRMATTPEAKADAEPRATALEEAASAAVQAVAEELDAGETPVRPLSDLASSPHSRKRPKTPRPAGKLLL